MIKQLLPLFGWFFVFVAFFWFPCLPAWFIMKLDERAQVGPTCARLCEPQNPAEPWWYWNGGSKSNGLDISQVDSRNSKNGKMFYQCISMHEFPACARWLGRRAILFRLFEFPGWAVQTSQDKHSEEFWRVCRREVDNGWQRVSGPENELQVNPYWEKGGVLRVDQTHSQIALFCCRDVLWHAEGAICANLVHGHKS